MKLYFILSVFLINILSEEFIDLAVSSKNVTIGNFTYSKLFVAKNNNITIKLPIRSNEDIIEHNGLPVHYTLDHGEPHFTNYTEGGEKYIKIDFKNGEKHLGKWSINYQDKTSYSTTIRPEKLLFRMNNEIIRANQGDNITLTSTLMRPTEDVSWSFTKDGQEFKELSKSKTHLITDFTSDDQGYYVCKTKDDAVAYYVKLKDKYAVYWPLIGIAISILILAVIIVIYEKKRMTLRKQQINQDNADYKSLNNDDGTSQLTQSNQQSKVRV